MSASESTLVTPPITALIPSASQPLTTKQNLFIRYYIELRNGVKAAELAGYAGNYETLCAVASENLRKPQIKQAISDYFAQSVMEADEILHELATIARVPVPQCKGPDALVTVSEKTRALDLLGKGLQLWDRPAEQAPNTVQLASDLLAVMQAASERKREADAALALNPVPPTD